MTPTIGSHQSTSELLLQVLGYMQTIAPDEVRLTPQNGLTIRGRRPRWEVCTHTVRDKVHVQHVKVGQGRLRDGDMKLIRSRDGLFDIDKIARALIADVDRQEREADAYRQRKREAEERAQAVERHSTVARLIADSYGMPAPGPGDTPRTPHCKLTPTSAGIVVELLVSPFDARNIVDIIEKHLPPAATKEIT